MRNTFRETSLLLLPWAALWRCVLVGFLGIAGGFALFSLWLEEISGGARRFAIAVIVASTVAFIFESLNTELEGHDQRWSVPRLMVTFVLLVLAELSAMGFHSVLHTHLEDISHVFLGPQLPRWHVVAVIVMWLGLGILLSIALGIMVFYPRFDIPDSARISFSRPSAWAKPMARASLFGCLSGAVFGAAAMLIYVLVTHFFFFRSQVVAHLPTAILRLTGSMAVSWAIPGLMLGAMVPWLKRPASYPNLWSTVVVGAAITLALGTLVIHWLIAPALLFAIGGMLLRRTENVGDYWVVLALAVAVDIFGATHIAQASNPIRIQFEGLRLTGAPQTRDPRLIEEWRRMDSLGSAVLDDLFELESRFEKSTTSRDDVAIAALEPIVDRCKVHLESIASIIEQVREQETHFSDGNFFQRKQLVDDAGLTLSGLHRIVTRIEVSVVDEIAPVVASNKANKSTPAAEKLVASLREIQEKAERLQDLYADESDASLRAHWSLDDSALRAFELTLNASSGFWIATGLLACWSIRRKLDSRNRGRHPSGPAHIACTTDLS